VVRFAYTIYPYSLFISNSVDMDESFESLEMTLLMFFISLFVLIGGVESSHFLEYVGSFIKPFVQSDLLMLSISKIFEVNLRIFNHNN